MYEAPIWGTKGWLKPLSFSEAYDVDDILPAIREGLSADGKLYAAPFYGESSMLMYRKDLIEATAFEIGIRLEHLSVSKNADTPLKGRVELVESLGNETLIHVRLPSGQTLIVRQYERSELQMGDTVRVQFDPNHTHYFNDAGQTLSVNLSQTANKALEELV